ncbi:MAG: nucleotide exchange factor GrpE [Tistrella sp.]|jgi:molecular chaperone GrpE|uniref:Protein GrpE n=1 Tax=Tistrella mobilis TaxID=171437 RepID=A0A3B9IG71_9PROT|nr:nucleotide exchange factor GrpE [Tistrella sp.]MAD40482.1 nucleotide exchange factor GrpE [Tistrella sp.]MBA78249.1 nucleotide exchange factor GrpE [Tistrella sp.]HAE46287.1 nucleotide exchange factor GrpE [Tistrella mobilis]
MTDQNQTPEGTEAEASPETAAAESPEARIQALEAELAQIRDQHLRALADMENLRRRAQREVEDAGKYAVTKFARDVLAVSDNLERAAQAVPPEKRGGDPLVDQLAQGVDMTLSSFRQTLETHGIRRVDPLGERFDSKLHQAMMEVEDRTKPAGTVVQVLQTGYVIADRLLRPAMVAVSRGGPKEGAPAPETPGSRVDTSA